MTKEWLSGLALLSIENETTWQINYFALITLNFPVKIVFYTT